MVDQKPPRFESDERTTLMALLQYQRDSLVRKVDGLDDEQARRPFVPTGTSLLWLVKHLRAAEVLWFLRRFAAVDVPLVDDTVHDGDTLAGALDAYRAVWREVDEVIAGSTLDDSCRGLAADEPPANLRWVIAHLLEETARHAGHADILRELIDGQTGR